MSLLLEQKIEDLSAYVAVVGLGYVGLPLATRAAEIGYRVTGIDKYMAAGRRREIEGLGIPVESDFDRVRDCDIVVICVPTPLREGTQPDTSFIEEAARDIASNFGDGSPEKLVVLESTSYPGTTREVLLPIFEERGISLGRGLALAYAPERVDPGKDRMGLEEIPRVVGGLDEISGHIARSFYSRLLNSVMLVSRPEVAEMTKLLENIFRAVNIALVNEMSLLCRRMGIDVWEVVEAAASKPFGFMSFKPGPGLGGHCIPVDPFYLAWKAKQYDFYTEFIELAGKINRNMPYHMVDWIAEELGTARKSVNGSRVLVVGVAYKEDVADTRESPALKIIELLATRGAEVAFCDPLVESVEVGGISYVAQKLTRELVESSDCVLIHTAHSGFDSGLVTSTRVPVVDPRNALGLRGLGERAEPAETESRRR